MSHIHEVRVSNFQSHKKTVLKFAPGVNAIVGLSDCGKSAFFRALAWVIQNKPKGDKNLRSKWGGETSVTVEFADRTSVERKKTKDNFYILDEDEDNAFTAFKDDIPGPVYEALNMSEINLQTQMDAPFLLASSSSDVAKTLNKIANLTTIDTSLSNIRKRKDGVSREIANVKAEMKELEKQEESFSYLKQMEKDVDALNALMDRWGDVDNDHAELVHLIEQIESDTLRLDDFEILLSLEKKVKEALALHEESERRFQDEKALEFIIDRVAKLEREIELLPEFEEAEKLIEVALKLSERHEELKLMHLALNSIVRTLEALEVKLGEVDLEIETLEDEFHDQFPDQCPLCGVTT